MAEETCATCGFTEEPLVFCTNCGTPRAALALTPATTLPPALATAESLDQPALTEAVVARAAATPATPAGQSTLSKVGDGVGAVLDGASTVITVIVGLVWLAIGIAAVVIGISTGTGGVGWGGVVCIIYALWLLINPRGWKILIY